MRGLLLTFCLALGAHACEVFAADAASTQLDTIAQRALPCTSCHGKEGRAAPDGYYPRIAGKPAEYLFNQLVNFRDGRRFFPMMIYLTERQSDDYLRELATHFASQQLPYESVSAAGVPAATLVRGQRLVSEGDASMSLPACSACHESRNALGAVKSKDNPSGGLVLSWYAPSLANSKEAGVQTWSKADIVRLLRTGLVTDGADGHQGFTFGPMAEVVYESLQHTDEADLEAIAVYLKSFTDVSSPPAQNRPAVVASEVPIVMSDGQQVYADNCARCHGERGKGRSDVAPSLAGSRIVSMDSSIDAIRIVLYGGYAPGTDSNPRPFGMPPFYPTLTSARIASVLTYIRGSWGNGASAISADEVEENMTGPLW